MNCYLEVSINGELDYTFKTTESLNTNNVFVLLETNITVEDFRAKVQVQVYL